jgi:hypothetical protein
MKTQLLLFSLFLSFLAQGQGCIPIRNIVGFGQFMRSEYEGLDATPTTWLINVNTRYSKIARSYVGTERTNLPPEDERINETFTMNVSIVRLLSRGWSIGMDVPLAANARTTWQEHDPSNPAKIHHTVNSFGVGDIRIAAYKWLWSTTESHRGNIAVGLGLKFPTGNYHFKDDFYKASGPIAAPVNVTIQLGDGGMGFSNEINAYYNLTSSMSLYGNFFYLFNPRDENGVSSIDGGGTPTQLQIDTGDDVYSVPDSYSARAGANFTMQKFIFWMGARMEGQPTYDLIGESNGTRRAGYTISVEPGINYRIKKTIVYLFVPLTIERKTQQTVPDIARSTITGTPFISGGGFGDYMIFLGAVFRI